MAKTDKKAKAAKPAKETETAAEFKYGVKDIADELGIKETSVRVQLRNKGIEKSGKSYGWNTKAELKEVIGQLSAGSSKKSKDEDDEDEDEKPAKKAKKADKKAKPSKDKAKKAKTKKARDEEDEDEDDD